MVDVEFNVNIKNNNKPKSYKRLFCIRTREKYNYSIVFLFGERILWKILS